MAAETELVESFGGTWTHEDGAAARRLRASEHSARDPPGAGRATSRPSEIVEHLTDRVLRAARRARHPVAPGRARAAAASCATRASPPRSSRCRSAAWPTTSSTAIGFAPSTSSSSRRRRDRTPSRTPSPTSRAAERARRRPRATASRSRTRPPASPPPSPRAPSSIGVPHMVPLERASGAHALWPTLDGPRPSHDLVAVARARAERDTMSAPVAGRADRSASATACSSPAPRASCNTDHPRGRREFHTHHGVLSHDAPHRPAGRLGRRQPDRHRVPRPAPAAHRLRHVDAARRRDHLPEGCRADPRAGRHLPRRDRRRGRASAPARSRSGCCARSARAGGCTPSSAARSSPTSPAATSPPSSARDPTNWSITVGDLAEALPATRRPGIRRPRRARHARPVGVHRRVRRRAHARRRAALLRRHRHPALPRRRGDPRRPARSPTPTRARRWCAAGTSRDSPCGPTTG